MCWSSPVRSQRETSLDEALSTPRAPEVEVEEEHPRFSLLFPYPPACKVAHHVSTHASDVGMSGILARFTSRR